jgi:hypothetical protein
MICRQDSARTDFDRAYRRAVLGSLLARLRRRPDDLLAYHEVRRGLSAAAETCRGLRVVPVDQIIGSTDRCRDFDRDFRPRHAHCANRWVSVARAHGEGKSLPPVQLYRIGDTYFVRDGHHRVSVARVRGQVLIDAEVIEVLVHAAPPAADPAARPRADAGAVATVAPIHRGGMARVPFRHRAGEALVAFGHWLQGTPPASTGGLGRVAG